MPSATSTIVPLLIHQGKYQARIAGAAIAAAAAGRRLDRSTWSAHVATADSCSALSLPSPTPKRPPSDSPRTRRSAPATGVRVVDVNIGESVPGANFYADGYTGRARIVVDLDGGYLVGAAFVGPGISELLHSATVAVAARVPVDRLWHAVPCFPTISEVWLRLMEANRDLQEERRP
jgi:dihydrolipoamide dehydrogenase